MMLASKASEAIEALYSVKVEPSTLQVAATRKDFEGDYTLVVFPLLRISHLSPEATGNAIGEWVIANCPEVGSFNVVKGFLNFCLSAKYWNEALKEIEGDENF